MCKSRYTELRLERIQNAQRTILKIRIYEDKLKRVVLSKSTSRSQWIYLNLDTQILETERCGMVSYY